MAVSAIKQSSVVNGIDVDTLKDIIEQVKARNQKTTIGENHENSSGQACDSSR